MVKGVGQIYKHIQCNWTHPSQNNCFLPPQSAYSQKIYSTSDYRATIIVHNEPSPVSNQTTINKVDTGVNTYGKTQYFATPQKHNHSTPEICNTNTTNTQVQPNFYAHIFQQGHSTPTTSLKLPPYGKQYLCFQIYGKTSWAAQYAKSMELTKVID